MKLNNLTLKNFRGFHRFTLSKLGRVNLLVGTNNSGKTTVLEAAYLLLTAPKLWAIWTLLAMRGEAAEDESRTDSSNSKRLVLGVRHLFRNHSMEVGARFYLSADSDDGLFEVRGVVAANDGNARNGTQGIFLDDLTAKVPPLSVFTDAGLVLQVRSCHPLSLPNKKPKIRVVLDRRDGFTSDRLLDPATHEPNEAKNYFISYVTAASLSSKTVTDLFNAVVLTPEEDLVIEALRLLEPAIERLAPISFPADWGGGTSRGGIFIRLKNHEDRIPIGSMGDGIWRMLGLALSVVHARDSVLLIDEIDTGLHHTVMDKMWRFLDECSKRFNVQIIGTTHSRDCYQSLATICRDHVDEPGQSDITIQRIERNRSESVAYSEAMIIAAAENDVEVR